ncbi:hypothetical protein M0Q50_03275 [bacterium]|jgi:hypothetical protein|nr:hypothetical protein [bacterium]
MMIYCKKDFCEFFKKGEIYIFQIHDNDVCVNDFRCDRFWHFKKNKEDSDDSYFNSYIYDYFYTPDEYKRLLRNKKLDSL